MARTTRRPRTRKTNQVGLVTPVRRKAYWGVFNQHLKRVALFPYHQRQRAQQYADQLSQAHNSLFFVRPIKLIEEQGD